MNAVSSSMGHTLSFEESGEAVYAAMVKVHLYRHACTHVHMYMSMCTHVFTCTCTYVLYMPYMNNVCFHVHVHVLCMLIQTVQYVHVHV